MKSPFQILKSVFKIEDKPKVIAKGFALGSFIGMLPIPGFQMIVSLSIAGLLKFNKKAAMVSVFNTNLATGAFIFAFNYWLGRKILGVNPSFRITDNIDIYFVSTIFKAGYDVFLSLFLGGIITGIISSVIVYYIMIKILDNKRKSA